MRKGRVAEGPLMLRTTFGLSLFGLSLFLPPEDLELPALFTHTRLRSPLTLTKTRQALVQLAPDALFIQ